MLFISGKFAMIVDALEDELGQMSRGGIFLRPQRCRC